VSREGTLSDPIRSVSMIADIFETIKALGIQILEILAALTFSKISELNK